MATFADFMKPGTTSVIRRMKDTAKAESFRESVYKALSHDSPKVRAWGERQLKKMKYLRRQGRVEVP